MLRLAIRTTLTAALVCAGAWMTSSASADDCPQCRAGRAANVRHNVMGSVAYSDRPECGETGYSGNPYGPGPYNCHDRGYPRPDLFYNFYAHGPCGGYPAQMYVAPKPVPANVGHTYITYQPLMPHEFMYKHHRTYHQYYDGGRGLTRAKVIWW